MNDLIIIKNKIKSSKTAIHKLIDIKCNLTIYKIIL